MPMLALAQGSRRWSSSRRTGAAGGERVAGRGQQVVVDGVAAGLTAQDDGQRQRAVLELARVDTVRALPLLVSALRDRDPGVRLTAGRLLARRGAREATAAATTWLGESAPRQRVMGLLVLREAVELPDEARRAVERVLRERVTSRRAAGRSGSLAAHPAARSSGAVAALLDDELAEVRVRALRALAAAADPRVSLAVVRRLSDSDRGVRLEAATTLGALGDRRVVPALLRQLDEASSDPRAWVITTRSGASATPAALPALARLRARRSPRGDPRAPRDARARRPRERPRPSKPCSGSRASRLRHRRRAHGARARRRRAPLPRQACGRAPASPTSARLWRASRRWGGLGDRRATGALVAVVERARARGRVARPRGAGTSRRSSWPRAGARPCRDGRPAPPELRALALDALAATGGRSGRSRRGARARPRRRRRDRLRVRAARLAGACSAAVFRRRRCWPRASGTTTRACAARRRAVPRTAGRRPPRRASSGPSSRRSPAPAATLGHPIDARRVLGDAASERRAAERERRVGPLARAYLAVTPSARSRARRWRAGLAAALTADAPLAGRGAVIEALAADDAGGNTGGRRRLLAAAEALASARLSRDDQEARWPPWLPAPKTSGAAPRLASRRWPSFAGRQQALAARAWRSGRAGLPPSVQGAAAASGPALAGREGARVWRCIDAVLAPEAGRRGERAARRCRRGGARKRTAHRARWSAGRTAHGSPTGSGLLRASVGHGRRRPTARPSGR